MIQYQSYFLLINLPYLVLVHGGYFKLTILKCLVRQMQGKCLQLVICHTIKEFQYYTLVIGLFQGNAKSYNMGFTDFKNNIKTQILAVEIRCFLLYFKTFF